MYFYGGDLFVKHVVYRDNINQMKTRALPLYLLKSGKNQDAIQVLVNFVEYDINELSEYPIDDFSSETREQLSILKNIYKEIESSEDNQF